MFINGRIIKEIALSSGADQVGITTAEPLFYMKERLENRKKEHRITPFETSEPYSRIKPGLLLQDCQSIITIAAPYAAAEHPVPQKTAEPTGKVARCARSLDYHVLIETLCRQIIKGLQQEFGTGFEYRILCDRSPLLERELVSNSGLGLIGENCTLINHRYGSYTALGTILTTLAFEPDQPEGKHCMQCGRCREACPTGALLAPYIINPYLCLSYLTQASGCFPRTMRSKMDRQIYGCDICQEICPHNQDAKCSPIPEMAFSFFPAKPLLLPLLRLTQKEFKTTINLTSAGWRGKTILQRNAVIALGNIKDPHTVKPLAAILKNDNRAIIRLHTAWALGRIRNGKALFALEKAYHNDPDLEVRKEAKLALQEN